MSESTKRNFTLSPKRRALLDALLEEEGVDAAPSQQIPRRRDPASAPLSFAQQRLWFLYQLEPESPFYNTPIAVRFEGALDRDALERALSEVVRRHESLRTTFRSVEGETRQVIAEARPVSLPLTDLSALPAAEREQEALRLAGEEARRSFRLAEQPPLRAGLVRLSEDEHVVLITMHHIVSDGWAMGLLFREVATLYDSFAHGLPSPLAEPPVQYADYAEWQREWLTGEVLDEQLSYWKRQLAGAPQVLALPTDKARPAT